MVNIRIKYMFATGSMQYPKLYSNFLMNEIYFWERNIAPCIHVEISGLNIGADLNKMAIGSPVIWSYVNH